MFARNVRGVAIVAFAALLTAALAPTVSSLPPGGPYGGELRVAVLGSIDENRGTRNPGNVEVQGPIHSDAKQLSVSVARGAPALEAGESTTITVEILDAATTRPLSGAAIVLAVTPAGIGGNLSTHTGTTDASGLFTVTFSADPSTDVNFRITATATASGYASESGFTSVIVSRPSGTPVPPTTPALDTFAMIALIALFAFLYARWQVRRRAP